MRKPTLPVLASLVVVVCIALPALAADDWRQWRGPHSTGAAPDAKTVGSFNPDTGENVRWQTRMPGPSAGTPAIVGNYVFVPTEDTNKGRLFAAALDRKTGKVYRYPVAEGKVPEDWWTDIETVNRGDRERTGWPTQKPERLLERIMLATTEPGDHVGDWFSGSGTTAAVAQRLDRRFLAVDAEAEAIEVAAERLEAGGRAQQSASPRDFVVETLETARKTSQTSLPAAPRSSL